MLLKLGVISKEVSKLQKLLSSLGFDIASDPDGKYGVDTQRCVKDFQNLKSISPDGICGNETWNLLIESTYKLGDRLLYEKSPMVRGSDVSQLQHKLNSLGFDSGKEDGIFGPKTSTALNTFQEDMELKVDSICGPLSIKCLKSISKFSNNSSFGIREKYLYNPNMELIILAAPINIYNLLNNFSAPGILQVCISDNEAYGTINSIDSAFNIILRTRSTLEGKVEFRYFEKNNSFSRIGKTLAEELADGVSETHKVLVVGSETSDLVLTKKPTVQITIPQLGQDDTFGICKNLNRTMETSLLPKLFR